MLFLGKLIPVCLIDSVLQNPLKLKSVYSPLALVHDKREPLCMRVRIPILTLSFINNCAKYIYNCYFIIYIFMYEQML